MLLKTALALDLITNPKMLTMVAKSERGGLTRAVDAFHFCPGSPPSGGCGGGSGLSFPWETDGWGRFRHGSGGTPGAHLGQQQRRRRQRPGSTRAPAIVYRDPGIESQHTLRSSPTVQESEIPPTPLAIRGLSIMFLARSALRLGRARIA